MKKERVGGRKRIELLMKLDQRSKITVVAARFSSFDDPPVASQSENTWCSDTMKIYIAEAKGCTQEKEKQDARGGPEQTAAYQPQEMGSKSEYNPQKRRGK